MYHEQLAISFVYLSVKCFLLLFLVGKPLGQRFSFCNLSMLLQYCIMLYYEQSSDFVPFEASWHLEFIKLFMLHLKVLLWISSLWWGVIIKCLFEELQVSPFLNMHLFLCVKIQFFASHANRNIRYDIFKPIDQAVILAMRAVLGWCMPPCAYISI